MNNQLVIQDNFTVFEAINRLDKGGYGVVFVVDEYGKMVGLITDGDVRRAILQNIDMNSYVSSIMNKDFIWWPSEKSKEEGIKYLKKIKRRHLPILDSSRRIKDIILLDEENFKVKDNVVVLMAGGLGTRLHPLTKDCPKPLLKVGEKPILETILENFIEHGFSKFFISVNYKSEMIEDYFGNGSKWGIEIDYLREDKRLGTAGALSLLPQDPISPIIVMNGDLLTKVNFTQLLEFHEASKTIATMCVREYCFQIPYGVVKVDNHQLLGIEEKPLQKFFVNAGIYILNPEAIKFIHKEDFLDMPSLFKLIIEKGYDTSVFPIREYWLDIGQIGDFERANYEFSGVFKG